MKNPQVVAALAGPRSSQVVTGRISQPGVIAYRTELTLEQNENILSGVPLPNGFPHVIIAQPQSDAGQLEAAADQAVAACGGDAREAVKALIVANHFLETDLEKLKAAASMG
jgi:hypothetical protein